MDYGSFGCFGGIFLITIQETEFREKVLLAIQKAGQLDHPILVSEVQKIDFINPLTFFNSGKEHYLGERFYWKDPSDNMTLVGMGIAKQIQSDQAADRFFHVDKKWKDILVDSFIDQPYQESGIGPLLFGGFSFDPYKKKTKLWGKYAASHFYLPKYMLTIINGHAYLTTNLVLTKQDNLSLVQKIMNEREQIFQACRQSFDPRLNQLIETKAIASERWKETVDSIAKELKSGPMKKVVLARELRLIFADFVEAESVLYHLFKEQHDSFIFAFEANGDCFIGASRKGL